MSDYDSNDFTSSYSSQGSSPYSYNPEYTGGASIGDATGAYGKAASYSEIPSASASANSNWTCPSCGTSNNGSFCGNCGTARPATFTSSWQSSQDFQQSNDYAAGAAAGVGAAGASTQYGYGTQDSYATPYQGNVSVEQPGRGMAIASLVLGISAIMGCWTTIPAVILGIVGVALFFAANAKGYKGGIKIAGLILSIIGSLLAIFVSVVVFASLIDGGLLEDDYDYDYTTPDYTYNDGEPYYSSDQAKAAAAVVEERLGSYVALSDDAVAKMAAAVDEEFSDYMNCSMADMGIDSTEVAKNMLGRFTYSVASAYDESDTTATVYVDTEAVCFYLVCSDYYIALLDLDESSYSSDADLKQAQADLFTKALDEAKTDDGFTFFDLTLVDGAWTLSEESFDAEFPYIFGTY